MTSTTNSRGTVGGTSLSPNSLTRLATQLAAQVAAASTTSGNGTAGTATTNTTSSSTSSSLSGLLSGLRTAGFPKLSRSRATKPASNSDKLSSGSHSSTSSSSSGLSGKAACLPGCTTYPRCSCRLKNSLKDKIRKKFDLKSFLSSTAPLAAPGAHHNAKSLNDAKEQEHLSSIRMLADLLEDGKICIGECIGLGTIERLNACLLIPPLQNAALETLGVILQCWLKLDRSTAHQTSSWIGGKNKNGTNNVTTCKHKQSSTATSTVVTTGKKSKSSASKSVDVTSTTSSSSSCSCCTPQLNGGLCGTCSVCLSGTQLRFETWVQVQSGPTNSKDHLDHTSNNTLQIGPETNHTNTTNPSSSTTTLLPPPPPPPPTSLTISPTSGPGAILLAVSLKLLKQSSTRKMACYIISHYSSIPAAALVLIHMDGAINTLLEVYQSLSDSKDSQLLVHLSAIIAGLCSKPIKSTIPKLFPIVPVLLARFKHCANTLVVAYICTALGRLCDGQPQVAHEILSFNIASYLLFLYYSAVDRVRKREKARKDEIMYEDIYGLLGLLVFHDQSDVSVLLAGPKPKQVTPFSWIMKITPGKIRADFTGKVQGGQQKSGEQSDSKDEENHRSESELPMDHTNTEDDEKELSDNSTTATIPVDDELMPDLTRPNSIDPELNEIDQSRSESITPSKEIDTNASTPAPPTDSPLTMTNSSLTSTSHTSPSTQLPTTTPTPTKPTTTSTAPTTTPSSTKPGKLDLVDIIGQILDLMPAASVPVHSDDDHWYYFQRSCWQVSMILRSGSAPPTRIQRLLDGGVIHKLLAIMTVRLNDMPSASLCEAGQALSYTLLQATSTQMANFIYSGMIPILLGILGHQRCSVRCSLAIVDGLAAILAMGVKDRACAVKGIREKQLESIRQATAAAKKELAAAKKLQSPTHKKGQTTSNDHSNKDESDGDDATCECSHLNDKSPTGHGGYTSSDSEYAESDPECDSDEDDDDHDHDCEHHSHGYDHDGDDDDIDGDEYEHERHHQNKAQRRKRIKKQCTDLNRQPLILGETTNTITATSYVSTTPSTTSASSSSSAVTDATAPTGKSKRKTTDDSPTPTITSSTSISLSTTSSTNGLSPLDEAAIRLLQTAAQIHVPTAESAIVSQLIAAPPTFSTDFNEPIRRPLADTTQPKRRQPLIIQRQMRVRESKPVKPPTPFIPPADIPTTLTSSSSISTNVTTATTPASTTTITSANTTEVVIEGVVASAAAPITVSATTATNVPVGVSSNLASPPPPTSSAPSWDVYPTYNGYAGLLLSYHIYPLLVRLRTQYLNRTSRDEKLLRNALENVLSYFTDPELRTLSVFESKQIVPIPGVTSVPLPESLNLVDLWTSHPSNGDIRPPQSFIFRPRPPIDHRFRLHQFRQNRANYQIALKLMVTRRRQIRELLAWAAIAQSIKGETQTNNKKASNPKSSTEAANTDGNNSDVDTDVELDDDQPLVPTLDPTALALETERLRRKKLKQKKDAKKKKKLLEREEREKIAALHEAQAKFAAAEAALAQADAALAALAKEEVRMQQQLVAAAEQDQAQSQTAAQVEAALRKEETPITANDSSTTIPPSDTTHTTEAPLPSIPTTTSTVPSTTNPKQVKAKVAPPVIAKCRNYDGSCSSSIRCITGFEEYVELLCTEGCLICYHSQLPTKENSCFAQVCAQPYPAEQTSIKYTPEQQQQLFGGPQLVQIQLAPSENDHNDSSFIHLDIQPMVNETSSTVDTSSTSSSATVPISVPLRKPVRNSPCFTPDCPGKISSLLIKSGRGNQMKIIKVLVQFREVNLRRERERERESKKVKKEAEAVRVAKEMEEREREKAERLALRAIELRAADEERERQAAKERERERELALAKEEQREREMAERKARLEERERAKAHEKETQSKNDAKKDSANSKEREKDREREREYRQQLVAMQQAKSHPTMDEHRTTNNRDSPNLTTPSKNTASATTSTIKFNPLVKPFTSNTLLPTPTTTTPIRTPTILARPSNTSTATPVSFAKAASTSTATPTTTPTVSTTASINGPPASSPTNWASLMGGGSAGPSSSSASSSSAAAAAAAAALAASKLSRKQKKDRASVKPSLSPSSSMMANNVYYDSTISYLRTDMVLGGLIRCRATVPTRFLYVQHFSSLPELQAQCIPFGYHSITSCYNPTAALIEFDDLSLSVECYETLNGMYFARYADDPLMIYLDGQTEARPVLLPPLLIAPYGMSPYGNPPLLTSSRYVTGVDGSNTHNSSAAISKREKAKLKRLEAIASSKEERLRRRMEKSQYRHDRSSVSGQLSMDGLEDGEQSPGYTDSPELISSLPLHDDNVFPMLGEQTNTTTTNTTSNTSTITRTTSRQDDLAQPPDSTSESPVHAFLPTPLFDGDTDSPTDLFAAGAEHAAETLLADDDDETAAAAAKESDDIIGATTTTPFATFPHRANLSLLSTAFLGSPSTPANSQPASTTTDATVFSSSESWSLFDPNSSSTTAPSSTAYLFNSTFPAPTTDETDGDLSATLSAQRRASWSWNESAAASGKESDDVTKELRADWSASNTNSANGTALNWLTNNSTNGTTDSGSTLPFTSLLSSGSGTLVSSPDSPTLSAEDVGDVADDEFDIGGEGGWELTDKALVLSSGSIDRASPIQTSGLSLLTPNSSNWNIHNLNWNLDASDNLLPINQSSITSFLQQTFANSNSHQLTTLQQPIEESATTNPTNATTNATEPTNSASGPSFSSTSSTSSSGTSNNTNIKNTVNINLNINLNITNVHVTNVHNTTTVGPTPSPTTQTHGHTRSSDMNEPSNTTDDSAWTPSKTAPILSTVVNATPTVMSTSASVWNTTSFAQLASATSSTTNNQTISGPTTTSIPTTANRSATTLQPTTVATNLSAHPVVTSTTSGSWAQSVAGAKGGSIGNTLPSSSNTLTKSASTSNQEDEDGEKDWAVVGKVKQRKQQIR